MVANTAAAKLCHHNPNARAPRRTPTVGIISRECRDPACFTSFDSAVFNGRACCHIFAGNDFIHCHICLARCIVCTSFAYPARLLFTARTLWRALLFSYANLRSPLRRVRASSSLRRATPRMLTALSLNGTQDCSSGSLARRRLMAISASVMKCSPTCM